MPFDVELKARKPALELAIGERRHLVRELPAADGELSLVVDGEPVIGHRWSDAERVWVRLRGRTFVFDRKGSSHARKKNDGKDEVRAEMPGTIVTLHTSVGTKVASGDPLLTLESMKLQLEVVADRAGVVAAIHVAVNETFERGALLVEIATEKEPA